MVSILKCWLLLARTKYCVLLEMTEEASLLALCVHDGYRFPSVTCVSDFLPTLCIQPRVVCTVALCVGRAFSSHRGALRASDRV